MLGPEALHQTHLPVRGAGLELSSNEAVPDTACIGYQALALEPVLTGVSAPGLPALFERLLLE